MTDPVRRPAAFTPAPRHLRRRAFRAEVPPSLMGGFQTDGGLKPATRMEATPSAHAPAGVTTNSDPDAGAPAETNLRQKRRVALVLVILVSVSIPILALTLIFIR
ncbi:hypothetical protein J2Y68_003504 [Paenarthrobacter nitroguajacolicus]|nr:hypothetical protein [Paenarthrobacter nitroguajacolicus]